MTLLLASLVLALTSGSVGPAVQEGAASSAPRPWTILVYGGADNNADGPILSFLDSVRKAIDDDPGIELLLFIDRSDRYSEDAEFLGEDFDGARLYRITRDSAERLSGGEQLPEITLEDDVEFDSADPDSIGRFIAWGQAYSPARHYGLMIYSHANGESMCPDEESGHRMGIAELSDLIPAAQSVDFLALELCNMGGIEVAYQWRPGTARFGAQVLVAIPNAGPPLDWDRAFARIRTPGHASGAAQPWIDPARMTAADFGRLVVAEGRLGREAMAAQGEPMVHEAAACYDLRQAGQVKQAVDALARALAAGDTRETFLEMRGPGPLGYAMNYTGEGPYVDLYDLCRRTQECDAFDARVRQAAAGVQEALQGFVLGSFGMDAYPGFESGKNGVFIVLPPDRPDVWRRFAWYTPLAGENGAYGRWAFLADGATKGNGVIENWFELLDAWFDTRDATDATADLGGSNGYAW